ncbi:MAG: PEP/pyruvate-binding domain-containing protein, partial [Gemmatimonadota bacterium]
MGFLSLFGGNKATVERLRERLVRFRQLVRQNDRALTLMAEAGEKLGGEYVFDRTYLQTFAGEVRTAVHQVVGDLAVVTGERYPGLEKALEEIDRAVQAAMELRTPLPDAPPVFTMDAVRLEQADAVGEKMARLGEIRNHLGLSVPDGFVVSTRACWEFLENAGLTEAVLALASGGEEGAVRGVVDHARTLRQRILASELPGNLDRAIRRAVQRMVEIDADVRFAIRSSAAGEDGDAVAAGQYATLLGILPEDVPRAYKEVVASLFTPGALAYQRGRRVPPAQGMMAVGCLAMVSARASGVMYSLDPMRPDREVQLVASSWGLGKTVVDGSGSVDRFAVTRSPDRIVLFRRIAEKPRQYVSAPEGGVREEPVPTESVSAPSVTDTELRALSEATSRIERYMKSAQDVEWALDSLGRVVILQARPLRIEPSATPVARDLQDQLERYPVLLRGAGEVACRGIACGRVRVVSDPASVMKEPGEELVLVARSASPNLGGILSHACAAITDAGNATGHFAAVAREVRIPTIVDTGVATSVLRDGQEVTVDAEENVVYQGRVEELLHYQLMKSTSFEDTPEFRALRRMLRRIAPLHLQDPQDRGFTPDRCKTYHDIIRFAHEKAVASLTEMEWIRPSHKVDCVRRLVLPIPLDLILVDLGDAVTADTGEERVVLEAVDCRPLRPILEVLCEEGTWETAPADLDLDGFMSSATRAHPLSGPMAGRPEQNVALVSREYLHLSLRLGYHFNVVDTYLTDVPNDNYVYFRFIGGVTEMARRSRRAVLLRRILEHFGFVVEGRGDLVIGRTRGLTAESMVEQM